MAGTTTNAVSVLGEIFQTGKRPNTLLRLIGGIQGKVLTTTAREFPTNVAYSLRNPAQNGALEGANAPAAQTVTVSQATNVVQLIHETVSLTYLGDSDKTVTGVVAIPSAAANGPVQNPRSITFQVMARMETIQRDLNYSFLRGTFANPADPTGAALKTRGLYTCITTNVMDQSADAISADPATQLRNYVEALLKMVLISNGFDVDATWTLFAGTDMYANIAKAYEKKGTQYLMPEAEIFGVKIRRIVTNLGTLNLALDPDMPANEFAIFDLSVVAPVGLEVPGKGIIFMEDLAKTGSADNKQIYGQMGIDHGPEYCHGKCKVPANYVVTG